MSDDMYDIVCANCGEPDQVPFEPNEGSDVYCQPCYEEVAREREDQLETYEIVCAECGDDAEVPFEPDEDADVYCQSCHETIERNRRRRAERDSPRKQHGTRVSFHITCAECGEEAELDYVPKGVSLDEALCLDCLHEQENEESRWAEVRRRKTRERKSEWSIECAECGATDYLHFEPEDDRDYYCTSCYHQHEEPDSERLDDMQSIGRNVYRPGSDDT